MSDEVLFARQGSIGLITLNRPAAMNALTHRMALAMDAQLGEWASDPAIGAVVVRGAGERAFCAGGDIRHLYETGLRDGRENFAFFADEYRLNHRIKRYPKPYVALMDGIVMGGGVGVSVHGSHRIAGDRTLFAMPEVGIGLFPDVGGTYFLPRLPGQLGMYLALTGARLKAADTVIAGICDLYIPSEKHAAAVEALAAADYGSSRAQAFTAVAHALRPLSAPPGPSALSAQLDRINRYFRHDSLLAVVEALAAGDEWARAQLATIGRASPTSLHVAFRQMRMGATLDFEAAMRLEYNLARAAMLGPDFYEGVRAQIIDKDNAPKWSPSQISDVTDADVNRIFATGAEAPLQLSAVNQFS